MLTFIFERNGFSSLKTFILFRVNASSLFVLRCLIFHLCVNNYCVIVYVECILNWLNMVEVRMVITQHWTRKTAILDLCQVVHLTVRDHIKTLLVSHEILESTIQNTKPNCKATLCLISKTKYFLYFDINLKLNSSLTKKKVWSYITQIKCYIYIP